MAEPFWITIIFQMIIRITFHSQKDLKYCVIKIGEKLDCGEQMEIRHDGFPLHLRGLQEAIGLLEHLTIPMNIQYLLKE